MNSPFLANQFQNPYFQPGMSGNQRTKYDPVEFPPRHDTPMPLDSLDTPF